MTTNANEPAPAATPATIVLPAVTPSAGPGTLQAPAPTARALTLAQSFQGLIPQSIGEAMQLADFLARSQAIPKALTKGDARVAAATFLSVIMAGMEVGLTPLQACNNIFVISGNMGMKASLQLALVRKSGLMAYFDEGFDDSHDDPGLHFGWCEMERKDDPVRKDDGTPKRWRREFFRWQAEAVTVSEWEDGKRSDGKLSDRPAYQNWPERMYPLRARTWLIDMLFGDVLKGMPAVENIEGGQVVDAEVLQAHTTTQGDSADAILAEIRDTNATLATSIESGFDLLKLAPGRRLALLTQHRDNPDVLAIALRDEWGRRNGKGDVGTAKAEAAKAANLATGAAPAVETKPAQVETKPAGREPEPDVDEAGARQFAGAPPADDVDDAMPTATPADVQDQAQIQATVQATGQSDPSRPFKRPADPDGAPKGLAGLKRRRSL